MLKKGSINQKMIVSILIGCLLPFALGSFIIKNQTEEWLYNNYVKHTSLVLHQTAEYIDEFLDHTERIASRMAVDETFTNTDSTLNSYVHFDPATYQSNHSEGEDKITAMFQFILEVEDIISFISYGTEKGEYIEYPDFWPEKPYDPRTRGWYQTAIASDEVIISEPYQTQVTNELVISVDKRVVSDDQKIGVISLTINLDNIMNRIEKIPNKIAGNIFILSQDNVFISSPENKEWHMKSVEALGLKAFEEIERFNGTSFEGKLSGVDKVLTVYISPNSGWKYISIIDKSVVMEQSSALSTMMSFILVAIALIAAVLVFIISNRITKPIRYLTQIIKKMATFQFDEYEHKDFKDYTSQNSEIGEISRALNSMQNNYIELKSKISFIDEEIQSINLKDTKIHRLSLSDDNPFAGIANSVNGLLQRVYNYIKQVKQYSDEIHYLAEHDPLTNLPNRRSFHAKLDKEMTSGSKGAVILLDMDNFKSINDSLGHVFGDTVLQYVSEKLGEADPSIFVSRFGGDEFLILYKSKDEGDRIEDYIKKIFSLFKKTLQIEDQEVKIEFSMGISVFPDDSENIDQIIMNADMALYHVKNNGKNNFAYFNHVMANLLNYRMEIKKILIQAIDKEDFYMVYQPLVDLKTGRISAYEALVRLKEHAVLPGDFIRIAEENGLIIPLGRIVTKLTVQQMSAWNQLGLEPRPISINFSALQINDIGYKSYLLDLLSEYKVQPQHLIIEITEHVFMENMEAAIDFMNDLKSYGIRFAIDDFGAEYSTLSYLTSLPFDLLKIDRDLSLRFLELEKKDAIESLIKLAHALKLKIVAEGIEEAVHVELLRDANCDKIQGYYFCKPMDAEEVQGNYGRVYSI